jgi:hypothetical protein
MIKYYSIAFYIFLFTVSCQESEKSNLAESLKVEVKKDSLKLDPLSTDTGKVTSVKTIPYDSILSTSNEIILLIKRKDFWALSNSVHPKKGLCFFPYGYIDTKNSRCYSGKELQKFFIDTTIYKWGNFDGSGDEIALTNSDYYKKFIYDVDFAKAPKVAVDSVLGLGNSLINIKNVYPDSQFVEYHFSGFNKQYGGMDWRSLRLIFEVYNGKIYLIAISHDQWTS